MSFLDLSCLLAAPAAPSPVVRQPHAGDSCSTAALQRNCSAPAILLFPWPVAYPEAWSQARSDRAQLIPGVQDEVEASSGTPSAFPWVCFHTQVKGCSAVRGRQVVAQG